MQFGLHRAQLARDQRFGQLDRIALDHDIEQSLPRAGIGLLLGVREQIGANADAERREVLVAEILGEVIIDGR
jgi:hypothetical protein